MNPVWPTPLEEQLLLACFAPDEAASAALGRCSAEWTGAECDPAAMNLLPLVYRRWQTMECQVVELGRQAYLATWNRNRERMAQLAEIGTHLEQAGIRWMALKGAALALRQYADLGLRAMADLDILIHAEDLSRAVLLLQSAAYRAEEDAAPDAILRQARVRHAWQFFGEPDWNFDLHWRPVNRCYSPEVTRLFWEGAEAVRSLSHDVLVPSPSDQLFHVCVHGLQWDWTRKIRWIADSLTVLREPVDWARVCRLAESAGMSFRLASALAFLRERVLAPIPQDLPERLVRAALKWEHAEYRLLLKPCPLGVLDSIAWHGYHFRRIRPFDEGWLRAPLVVALPQYATAFLDAPGLRSLGRNLRPHLMSRLARVGRRR
jgi:hypothetical protein